MSKVETSGSVNDDVIGEDFEGFGVPQRQGTINYQHWCELIYLVNTLFILDAFTILH
jgi:hypothetical protein